MGVVGGATDWSRMVYPPQSEFVPILPRNCWDSMSPGGRKVPRRFLWPVDDRPREGHHTPLPEDGPARSSCVV